MQLIIDFLLIKADCKLEMIDGNISTTSMEEKFK